MEHENHDQKKLGLRIKSARVLTGLNQEEFALKCGLNHTSLRNWEFGRVYPRTDAIIKFIEALKNFDVFTTQEWIVGGSGEGPMFSCSNESSVELSHKPLIATFKKSIEDIGGKAIVCTVSSDDMKPLFNIGDVLGGMATNIYEIATWPKNRLNPEPVLLRCKQIDFQPRWLNFDGHKWWARSQADGSLKALSSDVIGIISLRLYKNKAEGSTR